MRKLELINYQEYGIRELSKKLAITRRVVLQMATGGGKTVMLSKISHITSKNGKVLILVHREELLHQTIKTIFKWYDIISFPITAGIKRVQTGHDIYVAMVETISKPSMLNFLKQIGFRMLIVDECHIGNFKKIYETFSSSKIIGFSATPVTATPKDPLKNYYDDIVCCIDTPALIDLNQKDNGIGLVQNQTWSIKGSINRDDLKLEANGVEFDKDFMGEQFSKIKNIKNALDAYKKHCTGKKTIVFNCNIIHSQVVCQFFKDAGIPSRHVDSANGGVNENGTYLNCEEWRKDSLKWFKATPGAVLHNVGIFTTGFDEPSVEAIMINRAIGALSLWLQMTGRGSRPYVTPEYVKRFFTIIDLGRNAVTHGDWCDARDWSDIFFNPKRPGAGGVAPVKECEECEAIVAASATVCKYCGFVFPIKEVKYDTIPLELELFTKNIRVAEIQKVSDERGYKEYYTLFEMCRQIVANAKLNLPPHSDISLIFDSLFDLFNSKAKEWFNSRNERLTDNRKKFTKDIFSRELTKQFNYASNN